MRWFKPRSIPMSDSKQSARRRRQALPAALTLALITAGVLSTAPVPILAQTPEVRAEALADTVCAACHGRNGLSISDTIPNLAGQRAGYLENQLRALRDGSRKSGVMNAIATQIGEADLRPLAAHYAAMPGPVAGAPNRSAPLPALAGSELAFPSDYRERYTPYMTMNFPATRQVRRFFASPQLLGDLAAGRSPGNGSTVIVEVYAAKLDASRTPITGADGFYEADRLLFYTAMGAGKGWGEAIPAMLRNGDWQYAVFTNEGKPRPGFSQGECLACHKPLDSTHYLFTHKTLAAARPR
jgi:cytochrome c553